ncbi:hypothetical protein RhiirB3_334631, partial [Rhizophagus irregularis]
KQNNPKNLVELEALLQKYWLKILSEVYQKLIESIIRRIDAILKACGYSIRY